MEDEDNLYLEDLSELYDIFLLDIDGVIWSGGDIINGAFEGLKYLEEKGKRVYFISNSSTKCQEIYVEKLENAGCPISLRPSAFYISGYTTAVYLKNQHPDIRKVYVIGMNGLGEELQRVGIEVLGCEKDAHKSIDLPHIPHNISIQDGIHAVIIGADQNFNYYKLLYATLCLNRGAKLFATNPDKFDMCNSMREPGNGSHIQAIQAASGVKALVLGKPDSIVVDTLILKEGFDPLTSKKRMIIVGDRLDTDIELGRNAGIDTLCVHTGCTTPQYLAKIREEHANGQDHSSWLPTYVFPKFGHFRPTK